MSTSNYPFPFIGEKSIGTIIFTWMWLIVLVDWPFLFAYSKISKIVNKVKRTWKDFIYYYPDFPTDPIAEVPILDGLRRQLVAILTVFTKPEFIEDALRRRKAIIEFFLIMVFIRGLFFVHYMLYRFEGFDSLDMDFWMGEAQDVKPVHIPAHWLK